MALIKNLVAVEKTCCIRGCSEPGEFQPVFVIRDPRTSEIDPKPAVRAYMQHKVCGSHRFQLSVGAVLTDRIWQHLRTAFKQATNGVEPTHNDVSLEFEKSGCLVTLFGKQFGVAK
jgi:hypothetical protein